MIYLLRKHLKKVYQNSYKVIKNSIKREHVHVYWGYNFIIEKRKDAITQILPCIIGITHYIIGKWTISHWQRRTCKNRHRWMRRQKGEKSEKVYFRLEETRGKSKRSSGNKQGKVERYQWKRRNVKTAHNIIKCHGTWSLLSAASPCFCFRPKIPVASQTQVSCHEVILNKCLINIWINRTWKECFCSNSSHHY
jgi:hypothetical protein